MKIGILGAGLIGKALAKLAVDRGHCVMLSSQHPEQLRVLAARISCEVGSVDQAPEFGEIAVLAIPFAAWNHLPGKVLAGKVVIDAMNYCPERDGPVAELDARTTTTSELVVAELPGSRLIKAFNAILARDLPEDNRPPVPSGRRALPIAGNDPEAKAVVAGLHEAFGFEALDAGGLAGSWRFERAKPAYCIPLDRNGLEQALHAATREGELPHGSWRR
ncbi:NADPH-dependent F420 reductase [Methylobacterium nonmethylotrophicum]|uniref:NADP oxidoreductase n=1 Tax=Methylobacterium nonmethylotrophicum TaxID=1141884 RepID=A0A4Z0NSQ8_9HYPH|nr:NAD(P)-binding domain-containing protein [Methylobacterium nonmethylotrophicum]TGD99647.1 NADP oxidoreductase [Methylobacterium nonmethylotrophicum]